MAQAWQRVAHTMDRMTIAPLALLRKPSAAWLFVLAILASACGRTPAAAPPVSADAWAVVDGREIKHDDVEKAYRRTMQAPAAPSEEEALTAKLNVLNELIVRDLLLAKAPALKVALTDTELDTAYAEGQKNITPEAFQQELAARNLTAADMKEGLRRDLLAQKVIEHEVVAKVTVTDQEVTDFFNANRAQFNRTEEAYHIAQIVVTPVRDAEIGNRTGDDAGTPQEAAAKAQMLMGRLKAGASFGDLAADFSEDPKTAPRGGDLGFVPVSALRQSAAPLRDAVLKASPGTVNVVSINGGHTLVLMVAHDDAGQKDPSMPAVKDAITGALRGRKEQLLRTAYLGALRNDAVIVNHISKRLIESQGKISSLGPTAPGAK